jgi:2-keto-4-pentenoate hydratase/2-oxohepta-3-ene-1,7-dioic acid hydratase in catechol pathway
MSHQRRSGRRLFLEAGFAVMSGAVLAPGAAALAGDSNYVVSPPVPSSIEVEGTDARFPVRRVYCLGRNFRAHAIESGDNPDSRPPFFFMKPADSIVADRGHFPYPTMSTQVEYEIEMVIALSSGGREIDPANALRHVFGYAVGLDMTRRDLQAEAKRLRRPWEAGKSFDAFNDGRLQDMLSQLGIDAPDSSSMDAYDFLPKWLHPR